MSIREWTPEETLQQGLQENYQKSKQDGDRKRRHADTCLNPKCGLCLIDILVRMRLNGTQIERRKGS